MKFLKRKVAANMNTKVQKSQELIKEIIQILGDLRPEQFDKFEEEYGLAFHSQATTITLNGRNGSDGYISIRLAKRERD